MDENYKNYFIVSILFVVVIIIIVLGMGYLYYKNNNQEEVDFTDSFSSGRESFASGDNSQARLRFEDALRRSTTEEEKALSILNLGVSYLGSDPAKGISLLKQLSLDEAAPNFNKAGAINTTIGYYMGRKNVDFALQHIFTGEMWNSFASDVSSDRDGVDLAARRAYEWSSDVFSTFIAEYRVAWWYAKQIALKRVSNEELGNYTAIIKDRIDRGDKAFEAAVAKGNSAPSQIGQGQMLKGLAMEGLYRVGDSDVSSVLEAYNNAFTIFNSSSDVQSRSIDRYTRYHKSSFLARVDASAHIEEIIETLAPIYETQRGSFFSFLGSYVGAQDYTPDDTVRADIINLAKIDPRFKELLLSLGWREEDLIN